MNASAVTYQRLARQWLATPGLPRASDVVRELGAVQAQDYAGAKWALAQRTRGATDSDIEREFAAGRIVRTHVLRPTWHFVAPEDLRWMLALTAPRVASAMASYNRALGLTPAVFRRSNATIAKALRNEAQLTRAELKAHLERAKIGPLTSQRLGHLMMQAELDAVVCSGARRGKQFTYALLATRVPPARALDRDEALLTLTTRYFNTRGPASAHDFGWWSGLAMTDVRRGIAIAGSALERVDVNDRAHWIGARSRSTPAPKARIHLLPNYDEYFIGYKDRGAIGQRIGNTHAVTGGNALIAHVVSVDGQLVGGWKRLADRNGVTVDVQLVVSLTRPERAGLAAEIRRFGAFLESPVRSCIR